MAKPASCGLCRFWPRLRPADRQVNPATDRTAETFWNPPFRQDANPQPSPIIPMMNPRTHTQDPQRRKADQDLLFKGLVIALIGAVVLLGPYFSRSPAVQELLAGARVVGWFALVLGVALLGRYFLRQRR